MSGNKRSAVSLIIFCILWLIKLVNGQTEVSCNTTANFTSTSSSFAINRDLLLNSLPSNVSSNSTPGSYFYSTAVGEGADRVYGHAICQADFTPQLCSDSLTNAVQELISTCPNQKEAISVSDYTIRYSNRPIDGIVALEPTRAGYNTENLNYENTVPIYQAWYKLMTEVTKRASMERVVKYATGEVNTTENQRIYVQMQCFPDLAPDVCTHCLQVAVSDYDRCCHGKVGGFVQKPSCRFRWDLYPFYNFTGYPVEAPPPSLPSPTKDAKGGTSSKTVAAIIVSILGFLLLVTVLACIFYRVKKKTPYFHHIEEDAMEIRTAESLQIDIQTLRVATNNFSTENKLGEGGFGTVYKGWLPDGQAIAVKRWSKNSLQGEVEFENEVLLLAKLQHKNLVRLLGYCFQETERLLVYEFVPNKSLDSYIFDSPKQVPKLDWKKRYNIIEGIARGIMYLHRDSRIQIIHRDLKPSNILIDDRMNAKISDFGTAKLFEVDQSQISTHRIVGTYGYMPPEYTMYGQISIKSDVFSFGVIVLEIISGHKVNRFGFGEVHHENLLTYAWRNWKEGTALRMIDENLLKSGSTEEMMRCVHIALLCVQEDLGRRPTMASIVLMLSSSVALPLPSTPAYFMSTLDFKSHTHPELGLIGTNQSVNEITLTDEAPR